MKNVKYKILLPLAVISVFLLQSCTAGDWRVYDTSEFSVEFPGVAKDTVTVEANTAGAKSYFEPVEGSLDSNMYYSVSLYSLPDSVSLLGKDLDEFLRTDVQIYAWSIGGELTDTGKVVKSGVVEGREYKVTIAGNRGISTVRKFAYGKHLYTLLVVTDNRKLENKAIRRFMDSFKLKKSASTPKK